MKKPVIWIEPRKIPLQANQPYKPFRPFQAVLKELPVQLPAKTLSVMYWVLARKFVYGGNWDLQHEPFLESDRYVKMKGLYEALPDFRSCDWYKEAAAEISEGRKFIHKAYIATNLKEVDEVFLNHLIPLLETMKTQGYQQRADADFPGGMIGRNGELIKTEKGRHRLAAALIVGANTLYPVRIVAVHKKWWLEGSENVSVKPKNNFNLAIRQLEAAYRK